MEIGVFLRPFLTEMLNALAPVFDICVFTASEKVYANSILDKIDPENKYFA
jgi:TFIIF-interacting CTD phosphatase-like protein